MPSGLPSNRKQRLIGLLKTEGYVSRRVMPSPEIALDVLHLAKRSLLDCLPLMEHCRVLTKEQVQTELTVAEALPLVECVHEAEECSKALRAARARVEELAAGWEPLTAGTETVRAEPDPLPVCIGKL